MRLDILATRIMHVAGVIARICIPVTLCMHESNPSIRHVLPVFTAFATRCIRWENLCANVCVSS